MGFFAYSNASFAEAVKGDEYSIDRVQLVDQQINLLKVRYEQAQHELEDLQKEHDKQISQLAIEKASKNLLDRASLDVSVANQIWIAQQLN